MKRRMRNHTRKSTSESMALSKPCQLYAPLTKLLQHQWSRLQRTCQPLSSASDKTSCTWSSHSTRSSRIFKAGGNIAPASHDHPVAPQSAPWASRFKSRADSHCALASFHRWQRYWCWACTWCRCNCLTFEWKHCQCSCRFFCCCLKG